jgi:hypothetical protein
VELSVADPHEPVKTIVVPVNGRRLGASGIRAFVLTG